MNKEELLELMASRRTVRSFLTDPVDDASLERILEAVTLPPSGAGLLPYVTIVVKNLEMKQKIRNGAQEVERDYYAKLTGQLKDKFDAMGVNSEKPFLSDAPVLLVIAGDTEKPYWLESTWLAIGYIVLAIENEGLGSVTYTPSDFSFIMDLLNIPDRFVPQVILPIGHHATKKPPKKPRPDGRVYFEECRE